METILKMWQSLSPLTKGVIGILSILAFFSKRRTKKEITSSALVRLKYIEDKICEYNSSLRNLLSQPYGLEHQTEDYPDWRRPKSAEIFALDQSQIDLEQAQKDLDLLTNNGYPENELSRWRSIFLKQRELTQLLIKAEEQVSFAYKQLDIYNSKSNGSGPGFSSRAGQINIVGNTGITELEESTRKLLERNTSILTQLKNTA